MRAIGRAAQVRRAWRDASSDVAASAIWWKHCVISWPSTALSIVADGSSSAAAGGDWSTRASRAAISGQRQKEEEAHEQAQGQVVARLAAADGGGHFLSDPRRLFRGMTLAMRTGLDIVRPVRFSLPPSLPPSSLLPPSRVVSLSFSLCQSFWLIFCVCSGQR